MGFFELFILIDILSRIPLWVFLIPFVILTAVCVRFWERANLRNTCIVGSALVVLAAIPVSVVQSVFPPPRGGTRLAMHFRSVIGADSIARYRYQLVGFGDTDEYWKLKNIDPNDCQRIVLKHNLKIISDDRSYSPGSLLGAPWWWPGSTKGYSVFEGDDGLLGSIEIWISKDISRVYLFKFTE